KTLSHISRETQRPEKERERVSVVVEWDRAPQSPNGPQSLASWASMKLAEALTGPMVYGCLYCARSYEKTLSSLNFADSKTLKEEKREELFENLKADESIGGLNKINLNEISHDSAIGLIIKVLNMGVLLTEVYVDTVGDAEKYRTKLSERFPAVKFVVAKKADSIYPVVSGASIVAKVTRDRALRDWVLEETAEDLHKNFGSGYPGDPNTKAWLQHHKHLVFGFPTLVRFSWGTCTPYFKDIVEVLWSVPLHFVKKFYHKLFSISLYVPAHLSSFPISFVSVWSEF
ncbi:Polynucleotidyl transferase, ribonuclease H-like superfamily protein, partial [Prunus dulcis]